MERQGMHQKAVEKLLKKIPSDLLMNKSDPLIDANKDVEDYLFEGDILLSVEQASAIVDSVTTNQRNTTRHKRQYYPYQTLWNKRNPIYFTMQGFASIGITAIRQATQFWSRMTCLNFVEHPWASPRIRFVPMSGCWSSVGRQSGWNSQDISLGIGCQSFGPAAHEIGHALGYFHTQSRPDRDSYVDINFNNVPYQNLQNFIKINDELGTSLHIGYDFGSRERLDAFAINPYQPTVLAKDYRYQQTMGQREKPSFGDIKGINSIYQCAESCPTPPKCLNRGIVNSRNCDSCICPPLFAGSLCDSLNRGTAPVCNSQSYEATSNWTTFRGQFSSSNTGYMEDCHWLIIAPVGKKIQLRLNSLSTQYCDAECSSQSIEINPGNFDLTGMRMCCSNSIGATIKSSGNAIGISGFSRIGTVAFDVQYKIV